MISAIIIESLMQGIASNLHSKLRYGISKKYEVRFAMIHHCKTDKYLETKIQNNKRLFSEIHNNHTVQKKYEK